MFSFWEAIHYAVSVGTCKYYHAIYYQKSLKKFPEITGKATVYVHSSYT